MRLHSITGWICLLLASFCARAISVETSDFLLPGSDELPRLQPAPPTPEKSFRLEKIASGLTMPLFLTAAPGDPRLFVLEKPGRIMIISQGTVLPSPFLDLSESIDFVGERGLLGLAFAPDYARSGRFYVCYTDVRSKATVVSRFRVSKNPDIARADSEERLIEIPQPGDRGDHKAGWIGFRPGEPDHLYIASGDGGGSNDPDETAQDLRSLRGKILRIDVRGRGKYRIPKGNPFVKNKGALPEIWAYGLRNPYRVAFDRLTGDMYIADVGQDAAEEISFEPATSRGGRNYGWPQREGLSDNREVRGAAAPDAVPPILDYLHSSMMTLRGAVIGGNIYRGRAIPALDGTYIFADFTNAVVRSFRHEGEAVTDYFDHTEDLNPRAESLFLSSLTSFGEDAEGELYVTEFTGSVFKLVP